MLLKESLKQGISSSSQTETFSNLILRQTIFYCKWNSRQSEPHDCKSLHRQVWIGKIIVFSPCLMCNFIGFFSLLSFFLLYLGSFFVYFFNVLDICSRSWGTKAWINAVASALRLVHLSLCVCVQSLFNRIIKKLPKQTQNANTAQTQTYSLNWVPCISIIANLPIISCVPQTYRIRKRFETRMQTDTERIPNATANPTRTQMYNLWNQILFVSIIANFPITSNDSVWSDSLLWEQTDFDFTIGQCFVSEE